MFSAEQHCINNIYSRRSNISILYSRRSNIATHQYKNKYNIKLIYVLGEATLLYYILGEATLQRINTKTYKVLIYNYKVINISI